jgi:CPA2 family monovalent cation:H+ antiporter-2
MSSHNDDGLPQCSEHWGIYDDGVIRLAARVDWEDGTPVLVRVADKGPARPEDLSAIGKVIIAGFGLAGRWIAEIFDRHNIQYTIVEKNVATVETQRELGRTVVEGDIAAEETLLRAGIEDASILALTVPDEAAVLEATRIARKLKPGIYIVARTMYSSSGMQASQLGADDVIKAEQVIARQFYEMLLRKIGWEDKKPAEA